ncbi:hypothetical protein OQJ35_08200 [Legionella pneumophila]|nr:hypothetical protein [Legionella pneumophila]MCW8428510.1 hypothetical protein [Legionella pneumophila]CZG14467.1 Uncharacterised protein [Legionella pneumophila]CZG21545.1 Uncharacterised protein [Legionella pneumophila]HAT6901377.1 hypothetical protein [Legionella pneumophila]HAT6903044.1 hypothetical protein [Legionella pneumophila]
MEICVHNYFASWVARIILAFKRQIGGILESMPFAPILQTNTKLTLTDNF